MKSFLAAGAALMLVVSADLPAAEAQTNAPVRWDASQSTAQSVQQGAAANVVTPSSRTNISTTTAGRRGIFAGSRRATLPSEL
jgi:hypothetical protein